jgi:hypothetical protein
LLLQQLLQRQLKNLFHVCNAQVSGTQPPAGEKRNMMYDSKAIAAFLFTLTLGEEFYLDKRNFYNPEPVGGLPDNSAAPPVGTLEREMMQKARRWW